MPELVGIDTRGRAFALSTLNKTLIIGLFCGSGSIAAGPPNVLSYHNDFARTGENTNEVLLTPQTVGPNTFGKLFSQAVDGYVYAQPLYVSNLDVPGQGTHNAVFVATEHNSVYAFDADGNSGPNNGLIWTRNLGPAAATPNHDFGNRYGGIYSDIVPEVGITGTPVIDLGSGTLYVNAFTHEGTAYFHRVHALNIANGSEQPGSPALVRAWVPGLGVASTNGVIEFDAQQHLQRPGLTLAGGVLYVAYSGYADTDPYHGWVIGFDAQTLQPLTNAVFNTTPNTTQATDGPNAGEGGIWMAGAGPAVDADNNLYLAVGNGSFNASLPGGTDYGDCYVKLVTANGLAPADFFAPYNQAQLAANDWDLGSGGPIVLPDEVGNSAHPHLLVGCGKEGTIYLMDRDNMGKFNPTADTQIVQELPKAVGGTWSSPAYFGQRVFYQGVNDVLKVFQFSNGRLMSTPVSQSTNLFHYPSPTPSVSANGTNNGIVWLLQTDGFMNDLPAVLHAYDVSDVTKELYSSAGRREDGLSAAVKFSVPTIVNGKVYVGGRYQVTVFGLRSSSGSTPELAIRRTGSRQITLAWTGTGVLEGASSIAGPWAATSDQGNPQKQPVSELGQRFYRVRR